MFERYYFCHIFHRILSKLYEIIAYSGGMQAITFSFTKLMVLGIFNMGVSGKT